MSAVYVDSIKDKSNTKTLATLSSSAVTLHSDATFPAGHIIQLKHFHYDSDLTLTASYQSIPFIGTSNSGNLDYGCPITKIASSNIYISGVCTHGFSDQTAATNFRGLYSVDAGSNWSNFSINGGVGDFFHSMRQSWGDADVRHATWQCSYQELVTGLSAGTVYIKIHVIDFAATGFINRSNAGSETDCTTITLMEVAT